MHTRIEESTSPYSAPVTLAFKRRDRDTRLCNEFKDLNEIIITEPQLFSLIEEIMRKTRDCKWCTALDINSALWSIHIRLKDIRQILSLAV